MITIIGIVFILLASRIAFSIGKQWSYINVYDSPTKCSMAFFRQGTRFFLFYLPVMILFSVASGLMPILWYAIPFAIIIFAGFYFGGFSAFREVQSIIERKLIQEGFDGDASKEATKQTQAIVKMAKYK